MNHVDVVPVDVAQLVKIQRQKLGFNLKVRKAKEPATGSYLYLSPKWQSHLQESQNETASESCLLPFIILSRAGIKTVHCLVSMATSVATGIKGVCYPCLVCKADQCGCFTLWSSGKLYLLKYK